MRHSVVKSRKQTK